MNLETNQDSEFGAIKAHRPVAANVKDIKMRQPNYQARLKPP